MSRLAFLACMVAAAYLGARGITDEGSVMLGGDMSRYAMNGAYLYDLLAAGGAWSRDQLLLHAERYYARYPALSLGHHPPLPSVALLPFYALFGVSMVAARLSALMFFLLAASQLFMVGRRLFGWQAASWAVLLFVTNVYVLRAGQYVLSEMPMIALVLTALNILYRYCDTGQRRLFTMFVVAAAASLYAKQLALFLFPVYLAVILERLGWRHLLHRHVILNIVLGAVLTVPLAVVTLQLSPTNVAIAAWNVTHLGDERGISVPGIVFRIVSIHLPIAAAFAVAAGGVMLALRRDMFGLIAIVWLVSAIGASVILAAGVEPARYAFTALPAYILMAASLAAPMPGRGRAVGVLILTVALAAQTWTIRSVYPSGATGYDAAAAHVIEHSASPTVLYDSTLDTGYFVFFTRKHDPERRMVVLRADQLLPRYSSSGDGAMPPANLYAALKEYGIQFVVIEQSTAGDEALQLLRSEVSAGRFVERRRIPIESRDPEAVGLNLLIYEYLDAQPPNLDAELDIALTFRPRNVKLRLRDLVAPASSELK
jgi:hypothetical protein